MLRVRLGDDACSALKVFRYAFRVGRDEHRYHPGMRRNEPTNLCSRRTVCKMYVDEGDICVDFRRACDGLLGRGCPIGNHMASGFKIEFKLHHQEKFVLDDEHTKWMLQDRIPAT